MKKVLLFVLCFALVFSMVTPLAVFAAVPPQLTVDLSNQFRTVTHVASGSLYGLANEGKPADSLIQPTKPNVFTQMAPNGGQLPNGETTPVGDALKVAAMAARAGGKVTIRMPDIYPNFPYKWVSWSDWYSKVDSMVDARLASGATNIYAYEIWNEPDGTWDTANAGSFNEGWKNTYLRIKAKDTTTKILGPSITRYNETWLRDFLTYCKNNNCLPDIMCWHELGAPEGNYKDGPAPQYIESHIRAYRALETSLGISARPISINEYAVISEEGVPGAMVRYFAAFERSGTESACAAFWFRPGRLSNIITDAGTANGGWHLYKWYGDMSGKMAMTTPPSTTALGLDGIASINGTTAYVLFGGAVGNNTIVVKGFGSVSGYGTNAHVVCEATPWYGVDTAVSSTRKVFEGDFTITNGQISVPVTGMDKSWGYRLVITPSGSGNTRYEAENATVSGGTLYSNSSASNGKYVGTLDAAGSYVQYTVNAASAGSYTLEIGYANGGTASSTNSLSVNGGTAATVTYPVTGGWLYTGNFDKVLATVSLNAGSNTIRLTKGTNYTEMDYIQLTAVPTTFELRAEAENATINGGAVYTSGYASSGAYVGTIDNSTSYVQFTVNVPTTKAYTMEIGYANGGTANSTHSLSINGGTATAVTYAPTGGWTNACPNMGYRKTITRTVNLNAGSNTVRFTKGTNYAELDYIKLN